MSEQEKLELLKETLLTSFSQAYSKENMTVHELINLLTEKLKKLL